MYRTTFSNVKYQGLCTTIYGKQGVILVCHLIKDLKVPGSNLFSKKVSNLFITDIKHKCFYNDARKHRLINGTPSRFPGTKVQMALSEPLIQEADPHITKLAIEAGM